MSSESEICDNTTPTAVPSNPIYTNAVNCQWGTCMQQFFCITDLVRHVEKTHIPKAIMKEYVCLWRNCLWKRKRFKDQCRLVKHLQIITGEESNKCSNQGCNKTFSSLQSLRAHVQRHTGEKHYKCQIKGCNKSFYTFQDFDYHQKRHSKQKPFACTFPGCDKRYTDNISLSKHIRNHKRKKKPSIETSDKLNSCLPVQGLQNNKKPLDKKHYTDDNERNHQLSKVEEEASPLIAAPPEQHPCHAHADTIYLQLSFPMFMIDLPDVNAIFDVQGLSNNFQANSNLQSQSKSPLQSLQLSTLSTNPISLVIPSLSSLSSSTSIHSHPQSLYKHLDSMSTHLPTADCIPSHLLPSNEDI